MSNLPESPYKGLAAFEDSELDALLFFGREREIAAVAANVLANRLTVLYGPSGVGKSSLLGAGVARRLRELSGASVVVHDAWAEDPAGRLIASVHAGPQPLEREFWRRRDVEVVDMAPAAYVAELERVLEKAL